ncbi:hypothetical protein EMIT036CA2_11273 [Chryseobacterium sp. IT-36CA2]
MTSVIGVFNNFLKHPATVNLINYSYGKYADSMISALFPLECNIVIKINSIILNICKLYDDNT